MTALEKMIDFTHQENCPCWEGRLSEPCAELRRDLRILLASGYAEGPAPEEEEEYTYADCEEALNAYYTRNANNPRGRK